ncbi:hypothetical protein GGP50_001371 [Salinibacter ruber]|nr:hypothetical protein [Salinibacter ruber]MCS3824971.1 hypothetical protein [Salinibacter ruber]MCS4143222.1 hypothetical protein [Salinibacter ruber]MCS4193159.1 hypothetical protein [Salinibacter ruber]
MQRVPQEPKGSEEQSSSNPSAVSGNPIMDVRQRCYRTTVIFPVSVTRFSSISTRAR